MTIPSAIIRIAFTSSIASTNCDSEAAISSSLAPFSDLKILHLAVSKKRKDKRMEWKACTPPPTSIVVVEPATITPGIVVRIL